MVGIGMLMLVVGWWAAWKLRRGAEPTPLLARTLWIMSFSGWIAVLAGWYTTEIGRQPWLVQGVLSVADAASAVPSSMIGVSLTLYLLLYAALLTAYVKVLFYLAGKAGAASKAPVAEGPAVLPYVRNTTQGAQA